MNTILRSPNFRKGIAFLGLAIFLTIVPSLIGRPVQGLAGESKQPPLLLAASDASTLRPASLGVPSFARKPLTVPRDRPNETNISRLAGASGNCLLDSLTEAGLPLIGSSWQQQPSVSLTISGTITYCAAAVPPGAANTTVNLTGDSSASTSTGPPPSTGNYSFTNLGNGSYVVTPTKSGAVSGISSLDAARVQQHILGPPNPQLTACQQLAADVSQNGTLSSLDAAFIQQFVINFMPINPSNHTGEWRFNPANRTYISITSDQTSQNFDARLLGEVTGNWTPAAPSVQPTAAVADKLSESSAAPVSFGQSVHTQAPLSQSISAPNAVVGVNLTNFTLPVTLNVNTTPFISFDLQISFNPAVVGFQVPPVSAAGLTASGWTVSGNVSGGNVLIISGFSGTPLSGTGTLLNLNLTRLGAQGTSTALTWAQANFDDNPATATNGNISIGAAPTAVRLSGCNVTGYDSGNHLSWQTALESSNLGFNIYREIAGERTLINPEIIAGSALLTGNATRLEAGQSYGWWDSSPERLQSAQYWIEEIDLNGIRTMHGPFGVRRIGGKPPRESQAELLSQLGRGGPTICQLPFAYEPGRANSLHTQAAILAAPPNLSALPALKINVREEGWYRITRQELKTAGFDIGQNPRNLQLFLDGAEQPMLVAGEQDGHLNTIEFFATGQDNSNTDAHVYWLVNGDVAGQRIRLVKTEGKSDGAQSFNYTVERRDRTIYFSSLLNGDTENFFGQVVSSKAIDQSLMLQHLDTTSPTQSELEIALQPVTPSSHSVNVSLNGVQIGSMVFGGQSRATRKFPINRDSLKEGENVITLSAAVGGDVSLVDYIRVTYPHTYTSDQNSLRMSVSSESQSIRGFDNGTVRVFDLTDPSSPMELTGKVALQSGSYAVTVDVAGQGPRTLLALTDNRIKSPASLALNEPSNLRAKKNKADLVVITSKEFFAVLDPLVSLRQNQGFKVRVVDIDDIFDEFSDGERTPQAVRDFLQTATTAWKRKPAFVLFAGHASLDPRNHLGFGNSDIVPTKLIDTGLMETASDDWFVDFNNDGLPELATGRLPFRTQTEAAGMVSKILSYEASRPSSEALLVSDENDGFDFEAANGQVRDLLPGSLKVNRVDRGRVDPAAAKAALIDAINRGQKIVNYVGHGSVNLWKGDLLTNDDTAEFTNADHLSVFIMMTCLNGYFQDAVLDSLAGSLLKARGGAVAVWASSGMTEPQEQSVVNKRLFELLFGTGAAKDGGLTLGEAAAKAKAATSDIDVRKTWILLGDPTMRVK